MKYAVRMVVFDEIKNGGLRQVLKYTDIARFNEYFDAREYANFKNNKLPPIYTWKDDEPAMRYVVQEEEATT